MAHVVGQHGRLHTTTTCRPLTTKAERPPTDMKVEKLGRPAATPYPRPVGPRAAGAQTSPKTESVDPG
jgi:hypothetical protein